MIDGSKKIRRNRILLGMAVNKISARSNNTTMDRTKKFMHVTLDGVSFFAALGTGDPSDFFEYNLTGCYAVAISG